ncbi:MAG: L,D-transpeptidase [Nostocaceae cyanobacterium]|nr:L,D-transpeptidase [Nostocaceae cyanobacterium]
MLTWTNKSGMRHLGNFLATVVLMLVGLFSSSLPILAESNTVNTNPSPTDNSKITETESNQESKRRWIEIDLSEQRLYGWEGKTLIYSFQISGGKPSTPTPKGNFLIGAKYRYNRMRGSDYDIPNVPYAMYFYKGYAIHGAFWHNKFGTPVSHGCVNLRVNSARKLYNWSSLGTLVVVHE